MVFFNLIEFYDVIISDRRVKLFTVCISVITEIDVILAIAGILVTIQ